MKTDQDNKKVLEIGVACIFKDGHVLIQTRPKGKSFPGRWEFPGGKIEIGESSAECVRREIYEELGATIEVQEMFFKDIHRFDNVSLILKFHKCKLIKDFLKPREKQKIKWVTKKDFAKFKFLPTNYRILKKLKKLPELT